MKRGRAFALAVLGPLAACCVASGDGKFFSAADDVREPNQKALLWLEDGRETLILQVKYEGGAGDFGWVVPVPGRPKVDTVPSRLFLDLARITRPAFGAAGGGGRMGGGAGGRPGVTVLEEVEVGPYDATVLAATDPEALAGWLGERGYKMPEGAAEVLKSYTDRGWYYVALRIDVARLRSETLAALQKIAPEIKRLENAPGRLAERVVRTADRGDAAEMERLVGGMAAAGVRMVKYLGMQYEVLAEVGYPFVQGPVREEDAEAYVEACVEEWGEERVLAAAGEAGLCEDGTLGSVQREILERVNRDLLEGGRSGSTSLGRMQRALIGKGPDTSGRRARLGQNEKAARELMAACRAVPPPAGDAETYVRWERLAQRSEGESGWPLLGEGTRRLVRAAMARYELYEKARSGVRWAVERAEWALASGMIEPLRLDFDTRALVYPLYITSLGGGVTDIQLYVLSDHRMVARGERGRYQRRFTTSFAGMLDAEALKAAPTLAELVRDGRTFLTELRTKLAAEEMTDDVAFARAPTDAAYREEVTAEELARRAAGPRGVGRGLGPRDRQSGRVPLRDKEELGDAPLTEPEFLLLGILAGLAVIVVGRGLLRRAAGRRGS